MNKLYKIMLSLCLFFNLAACQFENEKDVQEAFDKYLDEIVQNELTSDFMTYHYMLVDKDSFDVEKPEVTLGSLSLESTKESIEACKEELETLYSFSYKKLSDEQKDMYRLIEIQLKQNIDYENYLNFDFCFGDNKVNDNLITNFTEYRILNEEDVQDYIVLLNDTGRYLDEGIEKTKQLAEDGYIQNDKIKDSILLSCRKFVESEEIEKYFHEEILKIAEIDQGKREDYEKQVKEGVDVMQEAYGRIITCYEKLPTSKYQGSMSKMENGKKYFEYMIQVYSGSNRSVKEWISLLKDEIDKTIMEWAFVIWGSGSDLYEEMDSIELPFNDAQEIVSYLEKQIQEEYPAIEKVEYSVKYLDPSVANDLVSAYYVIPPLDATNLNTIKVNPKNTDMLDLYSTLAHEGFPGHLYQNNYAIQNQQPVLYSFLNNLGASEGWAEVAGAECYRLGNIGSSNLQEFMRLYNYINRILVEYVDIRVNYSKWNVNEIENYLNDIGLSSEIAESLYDTVIQYPAIYAPYALGTYEILHLQEKAEEELEENFDIKEFHQALLDTGLVHFEMIEKGIDKYIKKHQ